MSSSKAILEGATIDARTGGTLVYHVSNLDGTSQQMMAQALETAGIPQYNDPHPFITRAQARRTMTAMTVRVSSDIAASSTDGVRLPSGAGVIVNSPNAGTIDNTIRSREPSERVINHRVLGQPVEVGDGDRAGSQ